MRSVKKQMTGWGLYPKSEARVWRPERCDQLNIASSALIARGLGRSYSDAALNENRDLMLTERLNRFLDFDEESGILRVEGGASLEAILKFFVPRGWFLPVTPGTKFVTVGGCIAADVHGKNHHRDGSFSSFVREIKLLLANGSCRSCSAEDDSELFFATVGGMGLTGIIVEATLQLIPIETAYMKVTHHAAENLEKALELLNDPSIDDHYSVAWIDCLATGKNFGRSVILNGCHASKEELSKKMAQAPLTLPPRRHFSLPFHFPSWALNRWSIKTFNALYYRMQAKKTTPFIQDYDSYFYPLDAVSNWNRMYGKQGFIQYQFVIPGAEAAMAMRTILNELATSQRASFLAVLKRFGEGNPGYLSFPREGYTLALDIPIKGRGLFEFLDDLDKLVLKYGGRCYLAKDARLPPKTFEQMYPQLDMWQAVKKQVDAKDKFQSDLSRRLQMGGKS